MKIWITVLCVIGMLFTINQSLSAQSKNAFYVELLGNGLVFSANYDMRFTQETSWGGRVGMGYIGSVEGDGGVITVPIMINNLLGSNGKYFEIGAGITFLSANADFIGDDNVSDIIGTLSFKYRSQPMDGGFMWHIGLTPIIADGVFVPYWVGLGVGYAW